MNSQTPLTCTPLSRPHQRQAIPLPLLELALILTWSSGFIGARFSIDYAPASLVVFWRCVVVTV